MMFSIMSETSKTQTIEDLNPMIFFSVSKTNERKFYFSNTFCRSFYQGELKEKSLKPRHYKYLE